MSPNSKGSPVSRWVRAKGAELFGADLRSLAAFRIVLAVLVLGDLAYRAPDLYAHYTDHGVLPRSVLLDEVLDRWSFSLALIGGETFPQALLFGLTALAALALLLGYRTRLMSVVVWVLVLSIQWRNPLVLTSAENLLRLLLFWGMLLPLGARWSLDRLLSTAAPRRLSPRFLSFATAGLLLQIVFVYWFTVLLKSGPEWRVDGTAIYYALSIDQITTPVGAFLYQFPMLLTGLTFVTVGLEAFGPLLLFSPILTGPVRTATVLAFASFHLGILLTLYIGIFPWVAALCMVCFLPTWFWDKVIPRLRSVLQKYYGRVRVVGNGESSIERFFTLRNGAIFPLRNTERERKVPATVETTVLRSSVLINLLALFFLLYVFCWNLTTVSQFRMPESLVPISHSLGLGQVWDMFAPYPIKEIGWYVIPGHLSNGQQVDLMPVTRDDFRIRQEVSWDKPEDVPGVYKNDRWRTYLERSRLSGDSEQFLHLGRYLCREWNARHAGDERLEEFEITYMLERTLPEYQHSPSRKVLLWEHRC